MYQNVCLKGGNEYTGESHSRFVYRTDEEKTRSHQRPALSGKAKLT